MSAPAEMLPWRNADGTCGASVAANAWVSESAWLDDEVRIHPGARIGYYSSIGRYSIVGDDSTIGSRVFIGGDVEIGSVTRICAEASVGDAVVIGRGAIVEERAHIGEAARLGAHVHIGADVVIGDDVVIDDLVIVRKCNGVPARIADGTYIGTSDWFTCTWVHGATCTATWSRENGLRWWAHGNGINARAVSSAELLGKVRDDVVDHWRAAIAYVETHPGLKLAMTAGVDP